jgi:hypothetical protein
MPFGVSEFLLDRTLVQVEILSDLGLRLIVPPAGEVRR